MIWETAIEASAFTPSTAPAAATVTTLKSPAGRGTVHTINRHLRHPCCVTRIFLSHVVIQMRLMGRYNSTAIAIILYGDNWSIFRIGTTDVHPDSQPDLPSSSRLLDMGPRRR